jgi:transcriptional regulator with XRE-family HTH domain
MISLVERGEASATAVVLDKLAAGLHVPLATLFEEVDDQERRPSPVVRRRDQEVWRDPASGYVRRIVSPPGVRHPLHIVEVEFPPGQRVAFEAGVEDPRIYHQLWVLTGTIEVTVGGECFRLREGDCLAMHRASMFHNPTRKWARYLVVAASELPKTRRA